MTTLQEAGTKALDALRKAMQGNLDFDVALEAFEALRTALAQQELPQKERPDFMAGYDAGMADAKRMAQQGEQQPVAWYEYNQDLDAWFLAYGHNPKAKTRPLVFGDTAAPAPQAQQMEPTDDQLIKGVKAMRLFVTKNSVADFKLGYMAALAAAPAPQAQDGTFINEGTKSAPKPGFHDCTFDAAPQAQPICKLFGTLPVYDTPAPQPAHQGERAELIRRLLAIANTEANEVADALNEAADMLQSAQPVAQPAQGVGRTNPGDETGGAVERFGWQTFLGKSPEIIPATNGSFVWYSDYLKLWQSAQPVAQITDAAIREIADCIVSNLDGRKGVIDLDLDDDLVEEIMQEMCDTIAHGIREVK